MSVAASPPTVTGSVPSGSAPRQTRTNGFASHSSPIVVSSVCPGIDAQLVRQRHERVHDGSLDGLEVAATDGVLEQRVPGEDRLAVDHERDTVFRVSRRGQRLEAQAARLDGPVQDRAREALDELVVAGDVVAVPVRREHVRDGQPVLIDGGEQRLERCARVDEHRRAARLVVDEVRLREPARIHAGQDLHGS